MKNNDKIYYTDEEIAKMLGYTVGSLRTIRSKIKGRDRAEKILPPRTMIGRAYKYLKKDYDSWLKNINRGKGGSYAK